MPLHTMQTTVFKDILKIADSFSPAFISEERKVVLQTLVDYIQSKKNQNQTTRLNFICTHNSRRSHLSQIWAQTMAFHFSINNISCYSGGTEVTAMFPKVVEILNTQGFQIQKLSENENPVYAVKYAGNESPIVCFSKKYDDPFNPKSQFATIMTCDHADEACPIVFGAEARIPVTYQDPKIFDLTEFQTEKYLERSLEIAGELWWVFQQIN